MRSNHVLAAVALALSGVGVPAAARAEAPPASAAASTARVEARIVGTEDEQLVLDVGAEARLIPGQLAELWRPIVLRHPVTRAPVKDRYRIGSVRITEVLRVLSFARAEGDARHAPAAGDIVLVRVAPKPPPRPARRAGGKAEASPTVAADPEAEDLAVLLSSLEGTDLPTRAGALDAWLKANPESRFAPPLAEELALLRRLMAPAVAAPAVAPPEARAEAPDAPAVARFAPPEEAFSGAPLSLGIELSGRARGVVLLARHAGEVSFVSVAMRPAGEGYWVATLPAERVRAPSLEFFVEAVDERGEGVAVAGSSDAPLRVRVVDAPTPVPPKERRSTVTAYTDYADYNRLRNDDRVWLTEGVFGMRFDDTGIRALRTGFGVYRGVGGSVRDLDELARAPRSIGLTYGHLEGEVGFTPAIGMVARLALGLQDDGVAAGGQLHLRIGSDQETNLLVGGELLGGIGLRGTAELTFGPRGRFPVVLRTEVTNQPAGVGGAGAVGPNTSTATSDIGGRAGVQVGYRLAEPVVVFARASYQGRTIVHAGPGFGGGATLEW